MTKIISPVFLKVRDFFLESVSVALPVFRIMIPMIILVKILKEMGAIDILGQWLAPVMGIVGLPGSMGLVWAATMVAGFFPGMIIFAVSCRERNADSRSGYCADFNDADRSLTSC